MGADARERFIADGALILPGFFDAEELRDVRAMLDRFSQTAPEKTRRSSRAYAARFETLVDVIIDHEEKAAVDLARKPRLDQLTHALIGEHEPGLIAAFGTRKGCGQGWHQDTACDAPGQFVLNRIVFAERVSKSQGPLYYVPGSHRRGDLPRGCNHGSMAGSVEVLPAPGTLAIIHSRCYHRVGLNATDTMRIQLNMRCSPAGAPRDLADYAVFRNATWQHSKQAPFRAESDDG